jgi:hypothetical protein
MAKALVLAIGGMFTAVLIRLFGDELKAWMPWFTKRLLCIAIERLPEGQRERFAEEWASHINEVPGEIGKVISAVGCVSAAQKMTSLSKGDEPVLNRIFKRSLDVVAATVLLFLLAPLLVCIIFLIKLDKMGQSVFSRDECIGLNGKPFLMYRFRVGTVETLQTQNGQRRKMKRFSYLGYFLWQTSINELPAFLNVLRGEMTLVGPRPLWALGRFPTSFPRAGRTIPPDLKPSLRSFGFVRYLERLTRKRS